MNLYHAFSIGFNWYYLAAPAFVVVAFLIGWVIPRMKKDKRGEFIMDATDKLASVVAALFAITVGAMLFIESADGIIQGFDNLMTAYDSDFWPIVLAGFAIATLCLFAWSLYRAAFCFGRKIKIKQLRRKHSSRRRAKNAQSSKILFDFSVNERY